MENKSSTVVSEMIFIPIMKKKNELWVILTLRRSSKKEWEAMGTGRPSSRVLFWKTGKEKNQGGEYEVF